MKHWLHCFSILLFILCPQVRYSILLYLDIDIGIIIVLIVFHFLVVPVLDINTNENIIITVTMVATVTCFYFAKKLAIKSHLKYDLEMTNVNGRNENIVLMNETVTIQCIICKRDVLSRTYHCLVCKSKTYVIQQHIILIDRR
ncbi:uncharacterized protein LOC100572126 isoform X1 [Acyrthosiphon pisum]|uniref:Uncharacterized protein n=1 Tax=Acyrthosiphon pisum TaxID=7029 RepID=A0A8R2H6Q7_ACYPI|nr:uncharacterized protein LOC100572126 isoform X1 [Acyrthosiphon pisum]|eukprot:XP_016661368.1 PREDICTED: uncharacterized protein LOC100572126 isoform X1 [Acyrthosiphon pisum]